MNQATDTSPMPAHEDVSRATTSSDPSPGRRRAPRWVWTLLVGAAAITLAVVAFGGGDGEEELTAALIAAVTAERVVLDDEGAPGAITAEVPVLDAATLRLVLDQLLGDHVLVVAGASIKVSDDGDVGAALDAVAPNTEDLQGAVGLVYGDVGARAFGSLWTQHVAFFVDRAVGTARGDTDRRDEADEHLHHYERDFGSFTATATAGELPAELVTELLEQHVADISGLVAAHQAGDVEELARQLVTGHDYAADIGVGLAGGIVAQNPVAFPGEVAGGELDTAVELARALIGELAATAVTDPGSDARAAQLSRLEDAVADLGGAPATQALAQLLTAEDLDRQDAARDLAAALGVSDVEAGADALTAWRDGREIDLLDARVRTAHAAAYELAGLVLAG